VIGRPSDAEYAPFYAGYVSLVPETGILPVLERQATDLRRLALSVAPDHERYAYASGKWTIREVFGHLADAERVFGYRAFCISRGDQAPLPGFDEQAYVAHSRFAEYPLADFVREFALLRETNIVVLRRLSEPAWTREGTANGSPVSVRAIAFIMTGHVRHHLRILAERYLNG
jgi:DinB superfamily